MSRTNFPRSSKDDWDSNKCIFENCSVLQKFSGGLVAQRRQGRNTIRSKPRNLGLSERLPETNIPLLNFRTKRIVQRSQRPLHCLITCRNSERKLDDDNHEEHLHKKCKDQGNPPRLLWLIPRIVLPLWQDVVVDQLKCDKDQNCNEPNEKLSRSVETSWFQQN